MDCFSQSEMLLLGGIGTTLVGAISLLFKTLLVRIESGQSAVIASKDAQLLAMTLALQRAEEKEEETRQLLYRTVDIGERVVHKAIREKR